MDASLKDARLVLAPLALTAAVVTWAAIAISEKSWLYAFVVGVVGVADLPLIVRARRQRGATVALVIHAAVLVVGWLLAFAFWSPFVRWE